jgi:hypothetical protein
MTSESFCGYSDSLCNFTIAIICKHVAVPSHLCCEKISIFNCGNTAYNPPLLKDLNYSTITVYNMKFLNKVAEILIKNVDV